LLNPLKTITSKTLISPTPSKLAPQEDFSLPSKQRLKKPSEYQEVYISKQWGNSPHFSFNVLASNSVSKLGVTVSKKVSKLAVDRNAIKRQIKEFYRHKKKELQNASLVITAKPSSNRVNSGERLASLEELWVKVLKWQRWRARQSSEPSKKSLLP